MGHIPTVIRMAPSLFVHSTVQIFVHFFFSVGVAKLFRVPFNEMILASNANVGGPTTAAAMASNKRWQSLVLPALLTGKISCYYMTHGLTATVSRSIRLRYRNSYWNRHKLNITLAANEMMGTSWDTLNTLTLISYFSQCRLSYSITLSYC